MRLMCELPFHCLARSCHLEVLMVISIDSLLIKQLRKLLNVILVISLLLDKMIDGINSNVTLTRNSILENMPNWPISQQEPVFFATRQFIWFTSVVCISNIVDKIIPDEFFRRMFWANRKWRKKRKSAKGRSLFLIMSNGFQFVILFDCGHICAIQGYRFCAGIQWWIQDSPGGANPRENSNLLFGIFLAENCKKKEKKWIRAPRSATGEYCIVVFLRSVLCVLSVSWILKIRH